MVVLTPQMPPDRVVSYGKKTLVGAFAKNVTAEFNSVTASTKLNGCVLPCTSLKQQIATMLIDSPQSLHDVHTEG